MRGCGRTRACRALSVSGVEKEEENVGFIESVLLPYFRSPDPPELLGFGLKPAGLP